MWRNQPNIDTFSLSSTSDWSIIRDMSSTVTVKKWYAGGSPTVRKDAKDCWNWQQNSSRSSTRLYHSMLTRKQQLEWKGIRVSRRRRAAQWEPELASSHRRMLSLREKVSGYCANLHSRAFFAPEQSTHGYNRAKARRTKKNLQKVVICRCITLSFRACP